MTEQNKRKLNNCLPAIFIFAFFVIYVVYVDRVSYNVPHMDAWKGLAEIVTKYMEGDITFNDWFPIPHGEYFSLLGVPIYYILFVPLRMNYQALTFAGAGFLLIESIVIYRSYRWSIRSKEQQKLYSVLFVFVLLMVHNLNQWEIASFYCGFEFFLRIAFYCYMFSYIDRLLHKEEKRIADYVYGGILCVIAIIVISHAYFPGAIATVAITMLYDYFSKRDWKSIKYYLIVALFVIAAGIVYIATYSFGQASATTAAEAEGFLAKLVIFVRAFLIMAGAPLIHQSASTSLYPYYWLGVFNISVSLLCTICYFLRKEHKNSYMPLMLNLYGYVSIFVIAFVRLNRFEISYMTSSRYVVETTLILVGNVWVLIGFFAETIGEIRLNKKRIIGMVSSFVLLLSVVLGILNSNRIEWATAPYRKDVFRTMAYNMLNIDFVTDEALGIAQAPASDVRAAVEVIEKYELNVFHDVKTSEELQNMRIDTLEPYQYKLQSGVYGDSWAGPVASFYVKTGNETELVLQGLYPFEITGQEKLTLTVGDVVTEHYITEPEFSVTVTVPENEFVVVDINCDFYMVAEPDIRELSFVFIGFAGYSVQ